jgi:hypothetical protein
MWSFVQKKANKQWVWIAMDATTRQIIAFHVGDRSDKSGCVFHAKAATYSTPKLPPIPHEGCHLFHMKAAIDSIARLPPIPGQSCH